MTYLVLTLLLQLAEMPNPVPDLTLEADGTRFGAFSSFVQDESKTQVTLQNGWIDANFFELFPSTKTRTLTPGRHEFDPNLCDGRRLDLRRTIGPGRLGREREWALLEACPVSCEIDDEKTGDGHPKINTLTLRVTGVAAAL